MADSPNEALLRQFFAKLNAEDLDGLRTILGAVRHAEVLEEPVRGLFEGKDPQNSI